MKVVYTLKYQAMYYVKVWKLNDWWIMLFFGVQCRCSECQVKGYII